MKRAHGLLAMAAALLAAGPLYLAFQGWDSGPAARLKSPADTVILVTLDGVRPQELLAGPDPLLSDTEPPGTVMPFLMTSLRPRGAFLGDPDRGSRFGLGHPIGISIPSYQSIFSGRLTACLRNECGPPLGTTLIDDVARGFGTPDAVGFFAYSAAVCGAAKIAPRPGAVTCGPGAQAMSEQDMFAGALAYLDSARPEFLYIGLDLSDEIAHSGRYARYLDVLRQYDGFLRELDATIAGLAAEGHRVTLLVTTDHGRGAGRDWMRHVWHVAGTGRLWLLAAGHGIAAAGDPPPGRPGSLYDIRATVAYLLGLRPVTGPFHGRVLTGILDPAAREDADQQGGE